MCPGLVLHSIKINLTLGCKRHSLRLQLQEHSFRLGGGLVRQGSKQFMSESKKIKKDEMEGCALLG